MFYFKRIIMLFFALLLIAVIFAGCKQGMEQEGQAIVDELIEEGMPTQQPTQEPKPEPVQRPTQQPTPDYGAGIRFSEDIEKELEGLWMLKTKDIGMFGEDYAVFCDNSLTNPVNFITFRFHSNLPLGDIKQQFGTSIFNFVPDEYYYSGKVDGETNENAGPLEITFEVKEGPDTNYLYIGFMPTKPTDLVDEVMSEYWPQNGIANEQITDEMLIYQGFGYDKSNGGSVIYRMWQPGPELTSEVFDWYIQQYQDIPGFMRSDENPQVPRITFMYEITSSGQTKECEVSVDAFSEPGYIRLKFASDIQF